MLLGCSHINKSFGNKDVLIDVTFQIEEKERIALVGVNGAGKTTLFKILTGEMEADPGSGLISFSKEYSIGYLSQHPSFHGTKGIFDELMETRQDLIDTEEELRNLEKQMQTESEDNLADLYARYDRLNQKFEQSNGYALKSEVTGILKGLGFSEAEFKTPADCLSGGQKTRLALGCLLLKKPDLLILDEPTNHLDLNGISWLETYLKSYPGAILIASHDRYFLNSLVKKVMELENGIISVYNGNYSTFSIKKAEIRKARQRAYFKQQQEIHHQEQVIEKLRSFNREKSIKRAESRQKALDKMDRIEKPLEFNEEMRLSLTPEAESGNDVLTIKNLSKAFPGKPLFHDLSFEVFRGDRIAIIGDNGTGKSTLLKILNKKIPADAGSFVRGTNVEIGYYDQEVSFADYNKTLFDEISDLYPALTKTRIRNILAAYLFTGDEVFQTIGSLSGGERGRLSLAELMLSKANFLILDEPTNHLDVTSKEILEDVLRSYSGTILFVSHDRYFINRVATRILELTENRLSQYIGNYDDYLSEKAKQEEAKRNALPDPEKAPVNDTPVKNEKTLWLMQKEKDALRRKKENAVNRLEQEIEVLEARIAEIDAALSNPENATNSAKCLTLSKDREAAQKRLDETMKQWEIQSEELAN